MLERRQRASLHQLLLAHYYRKNRAKVKGQTREPKVRRFFPIITNATKLLQCPCALSSRLARPLHHCPPTTSHCGLAVAATHACNGPQHNVRRKQQKLFNRRRLASYQHTPSDDDIRSFPIPSSGARTDRLSWGPRPPSAPSRSFRRPSRRWSHRSSTCFWPWLRGTSLLQRHVGSW